MTSTRYLGSIKYIRFLSVSFIGRGTRRLERLNGVLAKNRRQTFSAGQHSRATVFILQRLDKKLHKRMQAGKPVSRLKTTSIGAKSQERTFHLSQVKSRGKSERL